MGDVGYSPEWDTAYENGQGKQLYIPSTLTQFMSQWIDTLEGEKVLELGCGFGCCVSYIQNYGGIYTGVDGSRSSISEAKALHPDVTFECCDFTERLPKVEGGYDLIFDRASVSHNTSAGIRKAIDLVLEALKPGGLYFGCDWFSVNHSEFWQGREVDRYTRTGYEDGQFKAVGNVHFTDERELGEIFERFEHGALYERVSRRVAGGFIPRTAEPRWISKAFAGRQYITAVWDLLVRKPA